MVKKSALLMVVLTVILVIFLLYYFGYPFNTSLISYPRNMSMGLIVSSTVVFIFFSVLLFLNRSKERTITESAGLDAETEGEKIKQGYELDNNLKKLRDDLNYVGNLHGQMVKNSLHTRELEKRIRATERIMDSIYGAIKELKEGNDYYSAQLVEEASKLSRYLPESKLHGDLNGIARGIMKNYSERKAGAIYSKSKESK